MKLFENVDIKTSIIIFLLVLSVCFSAYSAFETYQLKSIITGVEDSVSAHQPQKKPSDYKIGIDYNKSIKAQKPIVLLFYADWCHFCINFMPTYESLYKKYKHKYNFVKINVEDSKYIDVVRKYEITGFPTVFLVNTKKDIHVQLENNYFGDMNKMRSYLNDFYKENK